MTRLIGSFNAYNLVAIYGVAELLGMEKSEILRHMSLVTNVSGRFQHFHNNFRNHSDHRLCAYARCFKNVLETINTIRTKKTDTHYGGWMRG